jgi:hypothetical protein
VVIMGKWKIRKNKDHPLNNKDWLYTQYVEKDLSAQSIADICGDCTNCTVLTYIKRYGFTKPKHGWSKGLTKETDERIARSAEKNKTSHLGQVAWNNGLTKEDTPSLHGYEWSDEQKEKFSKDRSGENHPMFGKHHTPEAIEKIRISSTGRTHITTPEQRVEMSKRAKIIWETTDIRERIINILNSPEIKTKMLGPNNPQWGKPAYPGSGRSKGDYYIFPDGSRIWLRSTYEIRMANLLTKMKMPWQYEGRPYPVGYLGSYFPDFYLKNNDLWLEVKGYMSETAKEKLKAFHQLYPNSRLRIIYGKDLDDLERLVNNNEIVDITQVGISLDDQIIIWNNE